MRWEVFDTQLEVIERIQQLQAEGYTKNEIEVFHDAYRDIPAVAEADVDIVDVQEESRDETIIDRFVRWVSGHETMDQLFEDHDMPAEDRERYREAVRNGKIIIAVDSHAEHDHVLHDEHDHVDEDMRRNSKRENNVLHNESVERNHEYVNRDLRFDPEDPMDPENKKRTFHDNQVVDGTNDDLVNRYGKKSTSVGNEPIAVPPTEGQIYESDLTREHDVPQTDHRVYSEDPYDPAEIDEDPNRPLTYKEEEMVDPTIRKDHDLANEPIAVPPKEDQIYDEDVRKDLHDNLHHTDARVYSEDPYDEHDVDEQGNQVIRKDLGVDRDELIEKDHDVKLHQQTDYKGQGQNEEVMNPEGEDLIVDNPDYNKEEIRLEEQVNNHFHKPHVGEDAILDPNQHQFPLDGMQEKKNHDL